MNQFAIDMPTHQSGLRSAYSASGDSRSPAGGRAGPVRPSWPFLVNSSPQDDKQALEHESGSPSGFAS
ncbi:MAG: hypothetical protein V4593_08680 [Pseudomonadota bacterium]